MKRYILIFYLTLNIFSLNAQEEVKNFLLDTYKYESVISETDDQGYLYLMFYYKNRFEIKILDNNKNIIAGRTFKIKDFDKKLYPIGIGYDRMNMYVFFMDFKSNEIIRLNYDKDNTGNPTLSPKISIPKNEKYIETVNVKGVFKILTLDPETKEFIVRLNKPVFDTLQTIRFKSGCNNLEKVFLRGEKEVYAKRMFSFHDNIQNANFYTKIYYKNSLMRISVDDLQITHLFEIDFEKYACKYEKMYFHLHRCDDGDIKAGTSVIKDDRLFRLTYCQRQMNLSVVELDSIMLTKNYNITPEKPIDLKVGEIVSEVNYEDRSDTREYLRDAESFLNTIDPEGLGIGVSTIDEKDYLVQIGSSKLSYYTVTSPGFGPSFGIGSGVSIWSGGMGSPSVFNSNALNTYSKTSNVYFKTILTQESLQKSNNEYYESSVHDKIESYENLKVNNAYKGISTTVENDSEILYGYFNGKDDLYHLIKFKP